MTRPALLTLIAGPTASGKSQRALEIAEKTGAAIINADSQQLYADLRVLSARPTVEDEARVTHHLYGIADAAEAWSAGRWVRLVKPILSGLGAMERPALLVGGTGLYFSSLVRGLADIPDVPAEAREEAQALYDTEGETAFRLRLAAFDPPAEATIELGDRQRLTRAYSVARATGRSLSDWRAKTRPLLTPGTYDRMLIEPERSSLYAACDARVDAMLHNGALDEVRTLKSRALDPGLPAMKAVGVRELGAYLEGETTLASAAAMMKQATRNYAKRQLTWFRNQCADWPRV